MKVFEFAKEIGLETIHLMDKIKEWGLPVKSHMAVLSDDQKSDIMGRLEASSTKSSSKKKVVKKKAASAKSDDEAPAKKKASSKKASTKKASTKKTASKKVATKKSVQASSEKVVSTAVKTTTTAAVVAPVVTPVDDSSARRMVIRRTGDEAQDVQKGLTAEDLTAQKISFESAEPAISREPAKVEETQPIAPQEAASTQEEVVATQDEAATEESKGPKKATLKKTVITRNNIIGRMDLSRVRRPQPAGGNTTPRPTYNRTANSNTSAGGATARPAAPRARNLRTGFIAPEPMLPVDDSKGKREEFKKRRPASATPTVEDAAVKVENPGVFRSADFRKREAVFQPKKKKLPTQAGKKTEITQAAAHKRVIKVHNSMSVQDLAQAMGIKMPALTKALMRQGIMAKPSVELDFDTISLIVPEFQYEAENVHFTSQDLENKMAFGDVDAELVHKAPVVTVMGHVDHGKTTLLDTIRKAKVASGEAGGITQHIGAYRVNLGDDRVITFIDTPGHEAFTAMRARGANATDIAIIVVAADDGMMPQTQEAINHAKAAGVPIIVAVNKMDKQGANPDRIKQQLSDLELVPEEWGGTTIFAPVSALKGDGVDALLESIYLVAEMQELRANPKRSGTGIVIESKVEKGRGTVATLLVQDGTVRVGDSICAGVISGRIRMMMNDQGKTVKEVGPGEPVEISGLPDTPQAGDRFDICKDESMAAELAFQRKQERAKELALLDSEDKMSLDRIFAKAKKGDFKELPVVLKTDVAGSVEAIKGLIAKIQSDEVSVKFVHTAVGGINESDVLLASAAQGIIIGFNVRPDGTSKALAKEKKVEIKCYEIIYEIVDDVRKAMSGLLTPEIKEKEQGRAEIREVFTIPKIGTIAGSFITEGKIQRNNSVRLIREGKVIYTGKLSSLKRFKDDAKEVAQGFECGIGIENYNDLKVGDVVEAFVIEEIARTL
jgi:translation initiation factor IF-2